MSFKTVLAAVALATLPGLAGAQEYYASTSSPDNDTIIWSQPRPDEAPRNTAGVVAPGALDALLAPVALYPDQLLSQILMAATYPLEVVEAARWLERPENHDLTGDRLASALEAYDWDPSVKALAAFPEVLAMMNQDLDWMNRMGEAFIDSEGAVMDSVQRLRREARDAGKLLSDNRQRVVVQNDIIVVEPATLDTIYVPVYDARVAYGIWPYMDYPPYWFPPPPRYVYSPWISYNFVNVSPFWGWSSWDWGNRRIRITDIPRWRQYNRGRWHAGNDVWRHDPDHRRGVGRGNRFRGPFNNDRNVAVNNPRPDRFDGNRFDRTDRIRPDRDRDGRPDFNRDRDWNRNDGNRGAGLRGDVQANQQQGQVNARSVFRNRRPDQQLPNPVPQLPNAVPPLPATRELPAVNPVPNAPAFADPGRALRQPNGDNTDRMRLRRNPDPTDGAPRGEFRRDFGRDGQGRSSFRGPQGAPPPSAIQPSQPQSQPSFAQRQSDPGAHRFGQRFGDGGARATDQRASTPRASDQRGMQRFGDGGGRRGGGGDRGGRGN